MMLTPGLYDQLISQSLARDLSAIPETCKAVEKLDAAEAPYTLASYVSRAVRSALESMPSQTEAQAEERLELCNQILTLLSSKQEDPQHDLLDARSEKLLQILSERDPGLTIGRKASDMPRPETPMAVSSLLTGSAHEPKMFTELQKEMASADRIDMLVSFIRWSGLRLILHDLQTFTARGGKLRIITTSYMGATEVRAVDELARLPNTEIRISYDTDRTRLHAKTYVFSRDTGFTTAYVGSSNLSSAAMTSGLEWNMKLTAVDLPDTLRKIQATFDSYWHSEEFETYTAAFHDRLVHALKREKRESDLPVQFFDIRPYPYQQAILDQLQAEREVRGHFHNLLVAATGTGKTVIAAFDYLRFCQKHPEAPNRLLLIAHREEILRQSLATFQGILRDANFGELWVGTSAAANLDHLFISVQTLNSRALWKDLPATYYDFIVIDETHHAAADSYADALHTFTPQILLGLTATPERMDGKSILPFFDNRIAAEIRLPEAIDRKLLCPFQYFGVSDTVDLDTLRWVRGGYDREELSKLYIFSDRAIDRAHHILDTLLRYVSDVDELKALGFCVSVQHAHFMAEQFMDAGIPCMALDSHSGSEERQNAKSRLVSGEIRVIFVVDLYNEGVDIPEVNTLLFLRPTESLTIFLQQFGRGLRLCTNKHVRKDCLTVLDFIGAANRRYNFEEKFSALLNEGHHSIFHEITHGFSSAPKGCYIQLEKKASRVILDNIRQNLHHRDTLISRIQSFEEDSGLPLTLSNFLNWYHLTPESIYRRNVTFARLCVLAQTREDFHEEAEAVISKTCMRLLSMDSRRWILFLLDLLPRLDRICPDELPPLEQQMLRMFYATIWDAYAEDWRNEHVLRNLHSLADSPRMIQELTELLNFLFDAIDFIDSPTTLDYDCPLDVHCSYSQRQLLAALDYRNFSAMRQGVLYLPEKKTDLFLITLNKSSRDYSPTTMYEDYAISRTLFHWQSQSTTSAQSETGQRYIHHERRGSQVLLFVRECKQTSLGGIMPYTFLGQASYVRHTGSRPMNIVWKLHNPIPAKYMQRVQQVVS